MRSARSAAKAHRVKVRRCFRAWRFAAFAVEVKRSALFARAVGEQMIPAEDSSKSDYTISYTLDVSNLLST